MPSVSALRPCPRCGIMRRGRAAVALCKDCRYVLSRAEQALWEGTAPAVELSHGKEAA